MIEGNNTNELQGQLDITDVLGGGNPSTAEPGTPEGYDAEGHLMDYAPGDVTPSTDEAQGIPYEKPAILDAPQAPKAFPSGAAEGIAKRSGGPRSGSEEVPAKAISSPDRLTALAVEINAITEQTRGVVISAALAVGKRLVEAKGLCPEGRWSEWLEKSVSYSERKAQDMMRLYSEYGRDGQIPDSIAALDYSKAVALLSAPAEAREELALKAGAEDLSVRQLQDEIKMLKAERIRAQQRMDFIDRQNGQAKSNIAQLEAETQAQSQAIVDRDRQIREMTERVQEVEAKADAAESAAAELRKLHSDAEDRAAANAQRASDAVNRANRTAKDLAEARAEIARLEEQARSGDNLSPQVETVEVVPEAVTRELEELRAQLAEARAAAAGTSSAPAGAPFPEGKAKEADAVEKFKWFYANQMKPAFTTALTLLREVAREDGKAADLFATALTRGCQQLMNQLGTK